MRLVLLALPALLGAAGLVAGCGDPSDGGDGSIAPPDLSTPPVPDLAMDTPDMRSAGDLLPPLHDLTPPRIRFADPTTVTVGAQPLQILLVDIDGSGTLDLVTANYGDPNQPKKFPSTVGVLLGQVTQGKVGFRARPVLPAALGANYVAAADFDNDGKLDLAVSSFDDNRLAVYRGAGDGTFGAPRDTSPGNGPSSLAAADFDSDGMVDVAMTLNTDNQVVVLRGKGDGSFGAPAGIMVGVDPFSVAAADLDGDKHPDLVVANALSGTISVLHGNGDGTFANTGSPYDVGATVSHVVVVDLDGDGKLDVAAANSSEHSASVLFGNGDGTLTKELRLQAGTGSGSLCAGDLDGDHHLDLVVADHDDMKLTVLLGRGNRTFEPAIDAPIPSTPYWVACGDLDGNGRTDIIASDDSGFISWILLSLSP